MIVKNNSFSAIAILLAATVGLVGCGGGGSSNKTAPTANSSTSSTPSSTISVSSSTPASSASSSTTTEKIVAITGLVTDNTIPNANLTIYVGSQTFTTTSDENGKYTVNLVVDEINSNLPIKIVAKGSAAQSDVEFVTLLPSIKTLIVQAGGDATLNSIENFATNVTNVTTAEYALIALNEFSIATDADLDLAKKGISETEKLNLAALIKIVVDDPDSTLPPGVNSTLELVSNKNTSDAYAATLDETLISSTIKTIMNDKTLTPPSPLLGSWVMDDTNLQYPNKTVAVISFINNTDFMFVVIGKQPQQPDCSSGVEFGTYAWDQTTGAMNFKVTNDGNGDCGVARDDQPQTFTVNITGEELALGNGAFKKVVSGYPLAGSWTLVDDEGLLNIHTYISSNTLIAYSPESWGYLSYNYNSTTGDFTTHTISASNEDFVDDFAGVITKPNASQLSSYDSVRKITEIWTELAQLEYQFTVMTDSTELVGSWYLGDTTNAYPLQTHLVLNFSDNEYMITMDARSDDNNCQDGIERGTYSINAITGVINTQVKTTSLATSCENILNGATLKADGNMKLTWSENGNILATYFRLIGWNPLIGSWTRTNATGKNSTLNFLPDNHYLMTDDVRGIEFGNFSDTFSAGTHLLTLTPVSTNSPAVTVTYTQPDNYHLNFTYSDNTTEEWTNLISNKIVAEEGGNDRDALTAPNGGEQWKNGEQRTITWMTEYITGATVDLYVLHDDPAGLAGNIDQTVGKTINNKTWYKFASDVTNTGSYNLDPIKLKGAGNAYLILVVSSSDNTKFDMSNATFSLNL